MLSDTDLLSHTKLCTGSDAIPLAGDWGAAAHIHWDLWQSSSHLDQSDAKEVQRKGNIICESIKSRDYVTFLTCQGTVQKKGSTGPKHMSTPWKKGPVTDNKSSLICA